MIGFVCFVNSTDFLGLSVPPSNVGRSTGPMVDPTKLEPYNRRPDALAMVRQCGKMSGSSGATPSNVLQYLKLYAGRHGGQLPPDVLAISTSGPM